jgi:hypothetical protein
VGKNQSFLKIQETPTGYHKPRFFLVSMNDNAVLISLEGWHTLHIPTSWVPHPFGVFCRKGGKPQISIAAQRAIRLAMNQGGASTSPVKNDCGLIPSPGAQ